MINLGIPIAIIIIILFYYFGNKYSDRMIKYIIRKDKEARENDQT